MKIDPDNVLRLNNPEAVFNITTHKNNENVDEVVQYVKTTSTDNGMQGGYTDPSWYGFDKRPINAFEAVKKELREGWQGGCKLINEARSQVLNASLAAPTSRRLRASHGHVTGFNPNVPALMRGEPTAFSQWERKPKVTAVRLMCELVASATHSAEELVWRGAATLVIADLLQEAGYSVEIWALNTVSTGAYRDKLTCTAALVKGADQNPIPDLLASVLVSPRYYRVGMLQSPRAFKEKVPYGYGLPTALTPGMLEGTDLADLEGGIYIGQCFSLEKAVTKINQVVAQINSGKES